MAEEVMAAGCITGDRVNGLCDGVTGDWYCKFDTFHPAVDRGLPVTRVVSRVELQQILARYAVQIGGEGVIEPSSTVESYEEFTNGAGAAGVAAAGGQLLGRHVSGGRLF
jgi:zeaxanthin epoxidase